MITFRDIPEAITQADAIDDCSLEAADCLEEAIAGRIDDGLDISPASTRRRHEKMIHLPVQTAVKAALYLSMRETNTTKSELARRPQVDVREVRRMLNPHHGTKLPAMEQAFAVLGKQLELRVN